MDCGAQERLPEAALVIKRLIRQHRAAMIASVLQEVLTCSNDDEHYHHPRRRYDNPVHAGDRQLRWQR